MMPSVFYILGSVDGLLESIKDIEGQLDAIVVEGYEGVGKGKVLNLLSQKYGVTPYRPDYNLWQQFDLHQPDRWKMSGFFWDIFSHFMKGHLHLSVPMLFDRGVVSGSVYNDDPDILDLYEKVLRDRKVLHILVDCSTEDYIKFMMSRGVEVTEGEIKRKEEFTEKYISAFRSHENLLSFVYINHYDASEDSSNKCEGCGHYNYGWCRHPVMNCKVDPQNPRCSYSRDKEVQDIDTEMYSV